MEDKHSLPSKNLTIEGGDEDHPAESVSTGNNGDSDQVNVLQSPKTALMLLPEIWEPIFMRLTPTDFMRVSGLCPEWTQLLKPYKAKKLISQVLELGVEGGISKEVLLKCRDLNDDSRVAAEEALRRHDAEEEIERNDRQWMLIMEMWERAAQRVVPQRQEEEAVQNSDEDDDVLNGIRELFHNHKEM